jgi:hypothetical protein
MINSIDILPRHLGALQTTLLKRRSSLDERTVVRLYKAAKASYMLNGVQPEPQTGEGMWKSKVLDPVAHTALVTCTDMETGLFVAMSGPAVADENSVLLTFGQKYCVDVKDTLRLNIATKVW